MRSFTLWKGACLQLTLIRLRDGTGLTDKALLESALTAFNGALSLNRELGVAWLGLAHAAHMGDTKTAGESLDRAERLSPQKDPSIACEAALLALDNGDLQKATLRVDATEVHGQKATTACRGNISAVKSQLKQALYHYSDCLTLDANHIRAHLNRSSVYMGLDDAQKALDDAETLLDLALNSPLPEFEKRMLTCIWSSGKQVRRSSNTCLNKHRITPMP